MSVYRCAACGSSRVITSSENSGYSYSKGLLGSLIFGSGGAAAGVNGKSKTVYKCAACGLTLDVPMPDEWKNLIDKGVNIPSARKNLTLNGVKFDWDFIIEQFPNIEYTTDDTHKKQTDFSSDISSDFDEEDLKILDDLQIEVLSYLKTYNEERSARDIYEDIHGDARGLSYSSLYARTLCRLAENCFITKSKVVQGIYFKYGNEQYEQRRNLEKGILYFMQQTKDKGVNSLAYTEIKNHFQDQEGPFFYNAFALLQKKGFVTTIKINEDDELYQLSGAYAPPSASCPSSEVPDILRKYKGLLDDGIITAEEFEAKKKELLNL